MPLSEAERQIVAQQLRAHLQIKPTSTEQVQKYADKILSGKHDIWAQQLALALRDESQDIFAGLEDGPRAKAPDRPNTRTLLLLEDENERAATAASRKGEPRQVQSLEDVAARLEANWKAESSSSKERQLVAVQPPYLPSTASVVDLRAIQLADLKLEIHHRGSCLSLRRSGLLYKAGVALTCAAEDQQGEAVCIELFHMPFDLAEYVLTTDRFFTVKEPYFMTTAAGHAAIRIDHPSDVIYARDLDASSGVKQPEEKTAAEWKQRGNDLLGQKCLLQARAAYRSGLGKVQQNDGNLKLDLARNLARVDLELGQYEEAKTSALQAVSDGAQANLSSLDVKAYYRAASAAYHLREFNEAQDCLEKLLKLNLDDTDGKRDSDRVSNRLAEQSDGRYDFDGILSRVSAHNPRVDVADYTQHVEVKESSAGGRGLCATRDFALGELVLLEKAFASVFEKDKTYFAAWEYNDGKLSMASSTVALLDDITSKLRNNPSSIPAFVNLRGDYDGLGEASVVVDECAVIDTFQIRSIVQSNAFGLPTPSKRQRTKPFGFTAESQGQGQLGDNTGIFLKTAMMNHSCVPNVRKFFIGDVIMIRATRPISKGEEILQCYAQTDADVDERREMLESTWNFRCNCKLCAVEAQEPEEKRKNRDTLERRANQMGVALKNSAASMQEVAKADVLVKSLKGSYDAKLYGGLPCKASTYLHIGLIHHYMRQDQRIKCIATISSLFDSLGWKLDMQAEKVELTRKGDSETHVIPELVEVLLIARSIQRRGGGKTRQAEKLEAIAKDMYLAVNGVDCGWEQLIKSKG